VRHMQSWHGFVLEYSRLGWQEEEFIEWTAGQSP
jgi:hypothetical protein